MAVGRNRNKIYAIAVACFWVTVWVTVFTLPYLYYSADLGPKTGFVYTGLCFVSLAYVWFCVGEVTGRTMEEINDFFMKVGLSSPEREGLSVWLTDALNRVSPPASGPSSPGCRSPRTADPTRSRWPTRTPSTITPEAAAAVDVMERRVLFLMLGIDAFGACSLP